MIKTIGLVGMGKVGRTLVKFFTQNIDSDTPFELLWIVSKHVKQNAIYDSLVHKNIKIFDSIASIAPETAIDVNSSIIPDAIIIATRDSDILETSKNISNIFNTKLENKYIFHLSGALTSNELLDCYNNKATVAAIHPFQTFFSESTTCMKNIAWGIEFNTQTYAKDREIISNFVKKMEGVPIYLSDYSVSHKALYHATSVAASNFVTAAIALAVELALASGINIKDFLPAIINQTIENNTKYILEKENITQEKFDIKNKNIKHEFPLTGPIVRGDFDTVEKHLETLKVNSVLHNSYKYFSSALLELAVANNKKDEINFDRLREILNK